MINEKKSLQIFFSYFQNSDMNRSDLKVEIHFFHYVSVGVKKNRISML